MPPVFTQRRDLALDQNLESEARLTLILVAAGLGVLVVASVVIFFGYRLLGFFRFSSRQPPDTSDTTPVDTPEVQSEKPDTSSPSVTSTDIMSSNQLHRAEAAHATPNTPKSRPPFFLTSMRKHSSAPHRPAGIYTGFGRSAFQVYRPSASASASASASGASGEVESPSHARPSPPLAHTRNAYAVPQGIVTAHAAGWMKVADSVVGRHPDAKPLHARVATQADIDLISGHLHMPWAYNDTDEARPQPIPVKVLRPDTAPVFPSPPPPPEILKDVGNTRTRVVLVSVNNTTNSKNSKRAQKGKSPRPALGKENMPVAPRSSSSIPVSSGRHRT